VIVLSKTSLVVIALAVFVLFYRGDSWRRSVGESDYTSGTELLAHQVSLERISETD